MKIAFRISKMGYGGAERVFISVAEYIASYKQVEVQFVLDHAGMGKTEHLITSKGFKLISLNCSRTFKTIVPLKRYIEKEKPDILISAYTDTNFAAILSSRISKSNCKIIVTEHASLIEHWRNFNWIRRFLLNVYVKLGYRFTDHILAVSKGISEQLVEMGLPKNKVSFIHNPIRFNNNQINQEQNLKHHKILAVGRITKQKDYLTLLKAFKLLINNYRRDAHLIIVGGVHDISEKTKLDQYILSNDLSSQIEFIGFTNKVEKYYQSSDVFVLSSAWEGFGNVIVEALAFGLPVVSTNCNYGPAEILNNGEFGKLVPVGDSDQMAEEINKIILKNEFPKDKQIARAKEFSEEKIASQYYQLFQRILLKKENKS